MIILILALAGLITANIVEYTLNIEYKSMAINNLTKSVICVNNSNIGPTLRAKVGDTLKINVINSLWMKGINLHWHGISMKNTPWMDGTPATQCPIDPGSNMTYEFIVHEHGTYWYHSHVEPQRDDAFYGALIVEDPNITNIINYDEEYIIMISDFYHQYEEELMYELKSDDFRWPGQPYRLLVNGIPDYNLTLSYNKKYLIRFISATTHSYLNISIPGHNVIIVEVEGTYTNPVNVTHLWINAGERYTVLLYANNPGCYYINISSMSDPINVLVGMTYHYIDCDNSNYISVINNDKFDTRILTNKYPHILPKPNKNLTLLMTVKTINNNGRVFMYNNIIFEFPTIPILLSYYLNTYVPKNNTQIINVEHGDVIDIRLINNSPFQHTTHTHGGSFYVLNSNNPIKRDVVTIESKESVTIRMIFDNPGVWLAHCHSAFHVVMSLILIFAYPPKTIPTPPGDFIICSKRFEELTKKEYQLDVVFAIGSIALLVSATFLGSAYYLYKTKKLNNEELLLIH